MSLMPRMLLVTALVLFGVIALKVLLKEDGQKNDASALLSVPLTAYRAGGGAVEVTLSNAVQIVTPVSAGEKGAKEPMRSVTAASTSPVAVVKSQPVSTSISTSPSPSTTAKEKQQSDRLLPQADRIGNLFSQGSNKLPIVETIIYKSRVPWQKGRPAWLSDYAGHYATSRHFIARSLNGKADYLKQDISEGDRFNVFRLDKQIAFHAVVDLSRCKMWLYYLDLGTNERVLLKTYRIGAGRLANDTASGLLTPLGCYQLGDRVMVYAPKAMGYHNGQRVEMIRIFGTRWIPFGEEVRDCTAPAKGFGIHGVPWIDHPQRGLEEDTNSLGKHESDGCIRLATADIEEIFALVITKPTTIELVHDFWDAQLPGVESNP